VIRRTIGQMAALLVAAFAVGFATNAVRGSIDPGGNDPELLKRQEIERIALDDAARLLDDAHALFLDVRPVPEYASGHIQGAVGFSADDFAAAYAEIRDFLAPDLQIVLYGDATLPAVRAAEFLAARGHEARVLDGGWRGWTSRGLPSEGEAAP
jgi:rhodanese-related sulfurtransferase